MKGLKVLSILVLLCIIVVGMIGCGNKGSADSTGDTSSLQDESMMQEDTSVQDQDSTQQATGKAVTEVVEQTMPTANKQTTVENFLGEWKDINDGSRFAKITKTGTAYEYEDNEGKYPATFENGALKVKPSDDIIVTVIIDQKTGHMISEYQGNESEFSKK
jgi:hypothetical protein